jgi:hypothetical protein
MLDDSKQRKNEIVMKNKLDDDERLKRLRISNDEEYRRKLQEK